jgi:hypothetical protein
MSKRLHIFIVVTLGYVAGCTTTAPPPPVQSPTSQARSSGDFVTTWELTQDTLTIHTGDRPKAGFRSRRRTRRRPG